MPFHIQYFLWLMFVVYALPSKKKKKKKKLSFPVYYFLLADVCDLSIAYLPFSVLCTLPHVLYLLQVFTVCTLMACECVWHFLIWVSAALSNPLGKVHKWRPSEFWCSHKTPVKRSRADKTPWPNPLYFQWSGTEEVPLSPFGSSRLKFSVWWHTFKSYKKGTKSWKFWTQFALFKKALLLHCLNTHKIVCIVWTCFCYSGLTSWYCLERVILTHCFNKI